MAQNSNLLILLIKNARSKQYGKEKINLNDAYSLKTPEDSIELYKNGHKLDEDFAVSSNYQSPKEIGFNKH